MNRQPNIIIVAADALRADHLGCYGYARATSPRIDALADTGVLCEDVYCSGIPTQPSFTTLYTGQHPITHGVVGHGGDKQLSTSTPTLAELLLKAGYTTAAFDNLMRERLWFGRGYEYYIDPSLRRVLRLGVTCDELNARAIPWIRSHADEPFFVFLHFWETHTPYNPPARYRRLFYDGDPVDPANHSLDEWWSHPFGTLARETWLRTSNGVVTDAAYVEALYDSQVRHLDDGVGQLLDAVDDLGLTDETLFVFLSDHGESMTEHGIFFEHHGLYDCTLHIPLVMRWPGRLPGGTRLPLLLQQQDVAPTLLEAAGLQPPRGMDGRSFWQAATGSTEEPGRSEVISVESTLQAKWSLRTRDHKLIVAREPDFYGTPMRELYDLRSDPEERCNLVTANPELAASLEQRLESWIASRMAAQGKSLDPVREQGVTLKLVLETC